MELSGRVFVNWWAKNAGLLASEYGVGAGSLVALDVPASWRSLPLALAALGLGATLVPVEEARSAEVLVTSSPTGEAAEAATEVLAVTSSPRALRFDGELPPHAVDHAAEVRAQPDRLFPDPAAASAARWTLPNGAALGLQDLLTGQAGAGATSWMLAADGLAAAVSGVLATGHDGAVLLLSEAGPEASVLEQERASRAVTCATAFS